MRSLYHAPDEPVRIDLTLDELGTALKNPQGLIWVDFEAEPPQDCAPILSETFGFHPLAIDDALEESHIPRVDDWEQYLYLVLHAVLFDRKDSTKLETLELDVFLGENYVVTHHNEPIAAIDRVWAAYQRSERRPTWSAGHLLYRLADELVVDYMAAIEQMDEAIDQIEDQVFGDPAPSLLEYIFTLKRQLLHLRRIIAPQREVLNKLARGDYALIDANLRVFFRDVYDHLVRLHDIIESIRDLVGGALDTYLSVMNNRMNEVMKTLTTITILFLPISFWAGFFGMNFFEFPLAMPSDALTNEIVFALTLSVMILTTAGMYLWMRRRAWK